MNELLDRLLDADGKVKRWPKKSAEKDAILQYIQEKIEKGKIYTEKEINEIITKWHSFNDYALIRRMLYDKNLLQRTPDGRQYWVDEKSRSGEKTE
jgi:hypothetical protein